MNQLTEALAVLEMHLQSDPESVMAPVVAAARAYVRDWITCPTCNGNGLYSPTVDGSLICPGCVDGLAPSAGLIVRIAEEVDLDTYTVTAVLLASRREGEG